MWYFETINYRLHGAAKFILRKLTSKFEYKNMSIFAANSLLWVRCAKCSHHPGALKFLPKCFCTNSHTFQGAAKIFEKKTFFRYTLVCVKFCLITGGKMGCISSGTGGLNSKSK